MDKKYKSLSRVLREIRFDTDMKADATAVCNELGISLDQLTPAFVFGMLAPEQMDSFTIKKETVNLPVLFVEKVVYDEVEATLPDGSTKKVKVARKDENGKKVTEIAETPIRENNWSYNALFTLIAQAIELTA